MITRIEAKNYRGLRYVSQAVKPFQILIGPNASGKSTFLDVVAFVSDIVNEGLAAACRKRSQNYMDLTFNRQGGPIEFALEFQVPEELRAELDGAESIVRYEVSFIQENGKKHQFLTERLVLITNEKRKDNGSPTENNELAINQRSGSGLVQIFSYSGAETSVKLRINPDYSGIGYGLDDEDFATKIALWVEDYLSESVNLVLLDSFALQEPSDPGFSDGYEPDGSNIPWVIEKLKADNFDLFQDWLEHIRIALPDVEDVLIETLPSKNQRFLSIKYTSGPTVPSWLLSDGTLRFLALTLIAYQEHPKGIYMIEEPENGLHPHILELVYQSLTSVYEGQVMVATHSPLFLNIAGKDSLLIFRKLSDGSVSITDGASNQYLQAWDERIDLGTVFASGILR